MIFLLSVTGIGYTQNANKEQEEAFKKGSATYLYNQGNAYWRKGDIEKAIPSWSLAIEQNSNLAEAYYNRGKAYAEKNMSDKALSDLTKAINITSNDKLKMYAYYNIGIMYNHKRDFTQAISAYTKAIEINPKYAAAYKNRAVNYFFKKDYASSWDDIHRAEELGLKSHPDFIQQLKKASGKK